MKEIRDKDTDQTIAKFIEVMSTQCIYCKNPITIVDGRFYALEKPYNGCLHTYCAPYYDYPQCWPHEQPVIYYDRKNKQI